jgi:hypothetical protein
LARPQFKLHPTLWALFEKRCHFPQKCKCRSKAGKTSSDTQLTYVHARGIGSIGLGRAGMFESMILATSSGALLKFGSYPILFKSVKKSSVEEEIWVTKRNIQALSRSLEQQETRDCRTETHTQRRPK